MPNCALCRVQIDTCETAVVIRDVFAAIGALSANDVLLLPVSKFPFCSLSGFPLCQGKLQCLVRLYPCRYPNFTEISFAAAFITGTRACMRSFGM